MRLSYVSPFSSAEHRRHAVDYAQLAEAAGYEAVWMPEAFGSDAFTQLGLLAGQTRPPQAGDRYRQRVLALAVPVGPELRDTG